MKIIFTIFIFFITVCLFSYDMILTGDPVLEDIRILSLETNSPFLSFSPPLAPDEIKYFIDHIDESALSGPAREAYFRILARLSPVSNISYTDEIFSLMLGINGTMEGVAIFNTDISRYPRYSQIPHLFSFPFRGSFKDTFQIYIEPSFKMDFDEKYKDNFDSNFPSHHMEFTHNFSLRGFFAAGGDVWNFQIGRDRLYWGTAHTGSLTFSDNSPYFDFARFSIFSPTVKYSVIINHLPLEITPDLYKNDKWWSDIEVSDDLTKTLQRFFYLHRIDFKLFNKVSISIMEGVMAGNSPLDLRFMNPLIIFHDLLAWEEFEYWGPDSGHTIGSYASVEINWNIFKNFSVYGQFVMNELTFNFEPNSNPNSLGYMLGMQYAFPFNSWGSIYFLEFFYTEPYFNMLGSPFASFIQMDRLGQYYFLGFPRDTISVSLGTKFFLQDKIKFSGIFSWIASGEHNNNYLTNGMNWNWKSGSPYNRERTPTDVTEHKFVLSLGADWKPLSWFSLKANVTGIYSVNNNYIKNDNALGGQASLSASFHY